MAWHHIRFFSWIHWSPQQPHKRQQRQQQNTSKYIYNPDSDKAVTWNNKRYVYSTRKKVRGHWKHIPFPVTTLDTSYSTDDASPSSPLHLATPPSSLHVISALTCNISTLAPQHTRTHLKQHKRQKPRSSHQWTLYQVKPKQVAITFSWHYRQHRHNDNTKDSHTSMKWQHQARPIFEWTRQHLDSFLALAELACKWNIEPG